MIRFQPYAVIQTATEKEERTAAAGTGFQSYAVIQTATQAAGAAVCRADISILCSHTDCDSNNAQRLHFVYNMALCALPFLML